MLYDTTFKKPEPVCYEQVLDSLASIFGRVPLFTELTEPIRHEVTQDVFRNMYVRECCLRGEGSRMIRRLTKAIGRGKVTRKWLRKQLLALADSEYNARQIDRQLDRIHERMTYREWWQHFCWPITWDQIAIEYNRKKGLC